MARSANGQFGKRDATQPAAPAPVLEREAVQKPAPWLAAAQPQAQPFSAPPAQFPTPPVLPSIEHQRVIDPIVPWIRNPPASAPAIPAGERSLVEPAKHHLCDSALISYPEPARPVAPRHALIGIITDEADLERRAQEIHDRSIEALRGVYRHAADDVALKAILEHLEAHNRAAEIERELDGLGKQLKILDASWILIREGGDDSPLHDQMARLPKIEADVAATKAKIATLQSFQKQVAAGLAKARQAVDNAMAVVARKVHAQRLAEIAAQRDEAIRKVVTSPEWEAAVVAQAALDRFDMASFERTAGAMASELLDLLPRSRGGA